MRQPCLDRGGATESAGHFELVLLSGVDNEKVHG
jgi:hypothetical protein